MTSSIIASVLWIVWFVFLLVWNIIGLRNAMYSRRILGGHLGYVIMAWVAIVCCVAGIGLWGYRIYDELNETEEVTAPVPEQQVEAPADTLNVQGYTQQ